MKIKRVCLIRSVIEEEEEGETEREG